MRRCRQSSVIMHIFSFSDICVCRYVLTYACICLHSHTLSVLTVNVYIFSNVFNVILSLHFVLLCVLPLLMCMFVSVNFLKCSENRVVWWNAAPICFNTTAVCDLLSSKLSGAILTWSRFCLNDKIFSSLGVIWDVWKWTRDLLH